MSQISDLPDLLEDAPRRFTARRLPVGVIASFLHRLQTARSA
ncbi:hypothetical protein [Aliiroseovarius marinus]